MKTYVAGVARQKRNIFGLRDGHLRREFSALSTNLARLKKLKNLAVLSWVLMCGLGKVVAE